LKRGALVVLLEMTVSRVSWTFNFDFYNYSEANVLWAIGWSMIVLAVLVYLPTRAVGAMGLAIIALHNVIDSFGERLGEAASQSPFAHFLQLLYFGGEFRWFGNGPMIVVLYTIIPWVGVMAAGYAFGPVMQLDATRRWRVTFAIGIGATLAFLLLRAFNIYGNPWPWSAEGNGVNTALSFLQTAKYPASLQFLLMTLGPTIALLPLLEKSAGRVLRWLVTFGRVPLFYYLLHIPLIHATALLISVVRTPDVTWWLFENHPLRIPPVPPGYRYSLTMLYVVTALCVWMLYFPCRWYRDLKARHRGTWLDYI
jgi:uncharacterized membrane protein